MLPWLQRFRQLRAQDRGRRLELQRHPCCWACWIRMFPRDAPMQVRDRARQACCWCGRATRDGIYVDAELVLPHHQEHGT